MKAILSLFFLFCLTLVPAASLQAASEEVQPQNFLPPPERAERSVERSIEREPRVSMDQASEFARQYAPGRVLNVRRDGQNWRVRVDQEGSVSDLLVNAESGRVSRDNDD